VTPHLTPVRADLRSPRTDKRIMLVAQKPADVDDPEADDLYRIAQANSVIPANAGPAFRTMSV
jgi:hypothetical protein